MADPVAHEVVPQAITKEVGVQNLDNLSTKVHGEVVKELDKGNWREGLSKINRSQEVDFGKLSTLLSKFGTEVQADGAVIRSAREQTLTTEIRSQEALIKQFLEHGLESLTQGQRDDMRDQVLQQARKIPALAPHIDRVVAAGQGSEFAMRYIKDPQFIAELRSELSETLNTTLDNNAIAKFEDMKSEEIELADKVAEFNNANAKLGVLQARRDQFAVDPNTGQYAAGSEGATLNNLRTSKLQRETDTLAKQQEISAENELINQLKEMKTIMAADPAQAILDINTQQAALTQEIQTLAGQIAGLGGQGNNLQRNALIAEQGQKQTEVNRLNAIKNRVQQQQALGRTPQSIDNEISQARTRLNTLQGQLGGMLAESQQLLQLEQEEKELPQQVEAAEKSKRAAEKEKLLQEEKVKKANREYQAAKQIHEDAEEKLKEKLEHSFGHAAERMIGAQLDAANEAFGKELEEMKQNAKDDTERNLYVTLQNTWLGQEKTRKSGGLIGFRKKETYRPFDKSQILADYSTLLREGDTAYVRSLLARTINPETDAPFLPNEIDKVFEKNQELIKKIRPESIKQLMARKGMTGGFTPEDIYIVNTSQWGREAIRNGLDMNADFRKEVGKVMNVDALNSPGFWSRFGQEWAKHPGWWTLLFGVPPLFKAAGEIDPQKIELAGQR